MAEACEHWRTRRIFQNIYGDVYDGKVWQDFEVSGFFSEPYTYGLLLNVDWFEPFEHSIYAVGVIFMALLNLPRNVRYNQENIIVCGLIPGPKEPSHNINSFLEPLVEDLLVLWREKRLNCNQEAFVYVLRCYVFHAIPLQQGKLPVLLGCM